MDFRSSRSYDSRRSPVPARNGMVATSQPQATLAGLRILEAGGNAADAAVAAAAGLQVTQPCSTGLGGDCFILYYSAADRRVYGLNGSGRSPRALSLDRLSAEGLAGGLPPYHAHTVTVPGAPAAWHDFHERFGHLGMGTVLEPAVRLARDGFPVSPLTSRWWKGGAERQLSKRAHGGELLVDGRGPEPGEVMRLPHLATSLETMARDGKRPFYEGPIADRIVEALTTEGGVMSPEDLAEHRSEWVEPISVDYRGVRVWECPPNGHGLAALIALSILGRFDLADIPGESAGRIHLLVECMRAGFADAALHVADPDFYSPPIRELLSAGYAAERARGIREDAANPGISPGIAALYPETGNDTVYFCVTDADGNGCSFINSNFMGFGTGIVPRECGYSLQNRGYGFSLDPTHPNRLEPAKRPYHTIIPGCATLPETGELRAVFGVMGGMMQPQGHVQVVSGLADDRLDPQGALDRPRFQLEGGRADGTVLVEDGVPEGIRRILEGYGHSVVAVSGADRSSFGLGQVIVKEGPVFWGGSDSRGDGCVLGLP